MKIIRKSLLNLIYILFILILTLSCSNDELIENDQNSINELNNAQGQSEDVGGYFRPNEEKADKAMRPSETLNGIIKQLETGNVVSNAYSA